MLARWEAKPKGGACLLDGEWIWRGGLARHCLSVPFVMQQAPGILSLDKASCTQTSPSSRRKRRQHRRCLRCQLHLTKMRGRCGPCGEPRGDWWCCGGFTHVKWPKKRNACPYCASRPRVVMSGHPSRLGHSTRLIIHHCIHPIAPVAKQSISEGRFLQGKLGDISQKPAEDKEIAILKL